MIVFGQSNLERSSVANGGKSISEILCLNELTEKQFLR